MVLFDEHDELREEKDWVESPEFAHIYDSFKKAHENVSFEPERPELGVESVQDWYYRRTVEIEGLTGLVDVALSFAEYAIVNGCKNMSELIEQLRTLFTLVYECRRTAENVDVDDSRYTLVHVAKLNDLERLGLIMSHAYVSTHELYVKHLQDWLLPFVFRQSTLKQRENLIKGSFVSHPLLQ